MVVPGGIYTPGNSSQQFVFQRVVFVMPFSHSNLRHLVKLIVPSATQTPGENSQHFCGFNVDGLIVVILVVITCLGVVVVF